MGLPPFSGFVSKFLMIYAAATSGHVGVAALLLLGGIIGVVYYTRVVSFLFYYPYKGEVGRPRSAGHDAGGDGRARGGDPSSAAFAPGWQLSLVATRRRPRCAAKARIASGPLPGLVADWPAGAAIAMIGAVAVLIVGRVSPVWSGRLAVAMLIAALAGVIAQAPRYDLLSFGFAVLIAGVGALNMLHSTAYLAHSHRQGRFFAAFTVMIAGLIGMTQAKDIFSFFAFWELMSSWALWAAIAHEETPRPGAKVSSTSCSTPSARASCSSASRWSLSRPERSNLPYLGAALARTSAAGGRARASSSSSWAW